MDNMKREADDAYARDGMIRDSEREYAHSRKYERYNSEKGTFETFDTEEDDLPPSRKYKWQEFDGDLPRSRNHRDFPDEIKTNELTTEDFRATDL